MGRIPSAGVRGRARCPPLLPDTSCPTAEVVAVGSVRTDRDGSWRLAGRPEGDRDGRAVVAQDALVALLRVVGAEVPDAGSSRNGAAPGACTMRKCRQLGRAQGRPGRFYQAGGSADAGVGVEGSGFGGLGSCRQPVGGANLGVQLTTPQVGVYGIGTGTTTRVLNGGKEPACGSAKSHALQ